MNQPLIDVRDASKTYGSGLVRALDGVSIAIHEGDFVSIMGPSGCGKSTLLNLIGALDLPTSGEVLFRGKTIEHPAELDRLRSREIGFVFQSFYLLPNLTAEENVQLPMFESDLSSKQRIARARELLQSVGLGDRLRHLPEQLSNGQKQRVAIARALANQPAILLADEPTGALDSASGAEVMTLLSTLNRTEKTTLLVVTHDAKVADQADRVVHMLDGKVLKVEEKAACTPGA